MKTKEMGVEEIKGKITPVLRRHHITRAGLFGSVATGRHTRRSDIDILVEFGNDISLLEFVTIKLELEDLLGHKVDLVEYQAVKSRLKQRVFSEEIRLYG